MRYRIIQIVDKETNKPREDEKAKERMSKIVVSITFHNIGYKDICLIVYDDLSYTRTSVVLNVEYTKDYELTIITTLNSVYYFKKYKEDIKEI